MYSDHFHNSNDWTTLINEKDLENSVIERIIRNEFHPTPVVYQKAKINWAEWLSGSSSGRSTTECGNYQEQRKDRPFIPALRSYPPYPQLSTLTMMQHHQCLRVLGAKNRHVQPKDNHKPSKADYQVFEEVKELYEKEQIVYLKWAKLCWINGTCIRALRPKPAIETVYEAEFKMRASAVQSLPQEFSWAAQISLETKDHVFEFVHKEDLIKVDVLDLPAVEYPEVMQSSWNILKPVPVPEPCTEHPCKFVLPDADCVSRLPLHEVHAQLAQYAARNNVRLVASENALRCLLETHRSWTLPVSLVQVAGADGALQNVLVVGSEFHVQKEFATHRTHKAYRHLLRHAFAPSTGHYKINKTAFKPNPKAATQADNSNSLDEDLAVSSDDERLLIDDQPNVNETMNKSQQAEAKLSEGAAVSLDKDLAVSSDDERLHIDDRPANKPTSLYESNHMDEITESNLRHSVEEDLEISSDDDDRLMIDDGTVDDNSENKIEPKSCYNKPDPNTQSISVTEPNICAIDQPENQPKPSLTNSDKDLSVIASPIQSNRETTSVTEPGSNNQTMLSMDPDKPIVPETNHPSGSNHVRRLSFNDNPVTRELSNKTNSTNASDNKIDTTESSLCKSSSSNNSLCEPKARSNLEIKELTTASEHAEISQLKPCFKKPASSESCHPRNQIKRDLNFTDSASGDTEKDNLNMSDSDSDNIILTDLIPLSCHSAKTKPKLTVTRTYGLRSRNQPSAKLPKISKQTKANERKSKNEQTHELRRSSRLTVGSKIDETNSHSKSASRNSNSNSTVTLRKSSRLNNTVSSESEEIDEPKKRKSPRISAILKTQEKRESYTSPQRNTRSLKIDDSRASSRINSPISNTTKRMTRRNSTRNSTIQKPMCPQKDPRCKSECCVKQEIGTETESTNQPRYRLLSYALSNTEKVKTRRESLSSNYFSNITDRKVQHRTRRYSSPSSKLTYMNKLNTLEALNNEQSVLSEKIKRYLRCSETSASNGDETDKADSQSTMRTKKYTRRCNASPKYNETEMSDTDLAEQNTDRLRKKKTKSKTADETSLLHSIANTERVQTINNKEQLNVETHHETKVDTTETIKFELEIELTEVKPLKIDINENGQAETSMGKTENLDITETHDTSLAETNIEDVTATNEKLQSRLHSLFSNSSDDSCGDDTGQNKHADQTVANIDSTTKDVNQSEENLSRTEEIDPEVDELQQTEDSQVEDRYTSEDQIETNGGEYSDQSEGDISSNKNYHSETNVTAERHRTRTNSTIASDDYNSDVDSMKDLTTEDINEIIGVNNCACKGTLFEIPPPRSFKKWQLSNKTSFETFDVIVHMSHKVRKGVNEVVLEPIVEYQAEYGGARQPAARLRALALELMLREAPHLLTVRLDYEKGEVILIERMSREEFFEKHGEQASSIADSLHSTLAQLRHLRPGQYILDHDSRHGPNAMLYATGRVPGGQTLSLRRDNIQMPDAEDANHVKIPPQLDPVLLPYHKFRKILPCAFTPYKNQIREDKKKTAAAKKLKHPPQAIQNDGAANAGGQSGRKRKRKAKKSGKHKENN